MHLQYRNDIGLLNIVICQMTLLSSDSFQDLQKDILMIRIRNCLFRIWMTLFKIFINLNHFAFPRLTRCGTTADIDPICKRITSENTVLLEVTHGEVGIHDDLIQCNEQTTNRGKFNVEFENKLNTVQLYVFKVSSLYLFGSCYLL